MKKYEYKFVEIPARRGLRVKAGDTFNECREAILKEAENGWRLKQVVTPFNEKVGIDMYGAFGYQIIFEREV